MYDIIFTGGGLSALLSAYYITRNSKHKLKLLFIDLLNNPLANKTLSFWNNQQEFPDFVYRKQWNKISIVDKNEQVHQLEKGTYNTIDSKKFEKWIKDAIIENSLSTFICERVTAKDDYNTHVVVTTTRQQYSGKFVFDSIINEKLYLQQIKEHHSPYIIQHFLGAELIYDDTIFDDTKLIFSDFSHNQSGKYEFYYLLPYSPTHALFELVSDSPVQKTALDNYISRIAGNKPFKIVYKEEGRNILSNHCFKRIESKRILRTGNAAGMIKASTGYAFNNIVKDSKLIARYFDPENGLKKIPRPNFIYRIFDRMFLFVITQKPHLVKQYLTRLFCKSKIDDVMAFLNEDITAGGFVRVTSSMMNCGIQYLLLSLRMLWHKSQIKYRNFFSVHPHNPVFPR